MKAVQEHQARIVGLSGFLILAIETMQDRISALELAGLANGKVMIGVSPVNEVVSRRMVKNQLMRWTQRGADLLLQVRTLTMNNEFRRHLLSLVSKFCRL